LKHGEERKAIAQAAYKKVIENHTYDIRAKQILEIIENR
jgi:hypothetical protein